MGNDIKPYFNQGWKNELFSNKTRVVSSLPRKSFAFVEKAFGNQLHPDICDEFLTSRHEAWMGDTHCIFESPPIYSASVAFSTLPGNEPQRLHRDDMDHHAQQLAISPKEYTVGRDIVITTFVADTRTTKENGTTRFIPCSHLQDSLEKPDESQAVFVELYPGDAFIMLASCYHAASANITKNEKCILYCMFMTKSILCQVKFDAFPYHFLLFLDMTHADWTPTRPKMYTCPFP